MEIIILSPNLGGDTALFLHCPYSSMFLFRRFTACTAPFRSFSTKNTSANSAKLDRLYELATTVNETSSTIEKALQVKLFMPCCHSIMKRIYDPHSRFYLSSKSVLAYIERQGDKNSISAATPTSLEALLDALSSRQLTGNAALEAAASFYLSYCHTSAQKQIFCRILDRNLKMGVSTKTIQQILRRDDDQFRFPSVALAHHHPPSQHPLDNGEWYASRKLDGVRCIALVNHDDIRFYSRTGRRFETLQKVEEAIRTRQKKKGDGSFVLDGEICVYDEHMEDFISVMKQIRTKQPMDNPVYEVFDLVDTQGFMKGVDPTPFTQRQQRLKSWMGHSQPHLRMVQQTRIISKTMLKQMKDEATRHGWEGLVLRRDVGYQGKRR